MGIESSQEKKLKPVEVEDGKTSWKSSGNCIIVLRVLVAQRLNYGSN